MMEIKSEKTEIGSVRISAEAIAVIAGTAALEAKGTLVTPGIGRDLVARMGRRNLSRGVKVELMEQTVIVNISLSVEFGVNIQEVCRNVQQKVKNAIETMTGLVATEVNVSVGNIIMPKPITVKAPIKRKPRARTKQRMVLRG